MKDFSFGGIFDSVGQLAQGYFGMKTAEAQADANGVAQATLANQTDTSTLAVNKVPLNPSQYQAVGAQTAAATGGASGLPFGLSQNQLMIGAAVIGALLIIKK
ncbi:MAG: hypothetical protein JJV99_02205 [Colwellia sp.]|nr:hypothetical protein [Colwellia sp.]